MEGIDYAWHPAVDGGRARAIRDAGKEFALRYVSRYTSKVLTRSEADALAAAGVRVGVVFEDSAGRAEAGYDAGKADAKVALSQARACGIPDGKVIGFAVDYDTTVGPHIRAYAKGFREVLYPEGLKVGIYGSKTVCRHALDEGIVDSAWQTYAWSGGRKEPRRSLYQYHNGVTVAGISSDLDTAYNDDWLWTPGEIVDPFAVLTKNERTAVEKHHRAVMQGSRGRTAYWRNRISYLMYRIRAANGGVPSKGSKAHRFERYHILRDERGKE